MVFMMDVTEAEVGVGGKLSSCSAAADEDLQLLFIAWWWCCCVNW
jgi:hypothetical protein